ncbi:hypothetical protein [Vibrio parahaemolyticus]|uniref:hypothetical protein n=1 Tax=Vibrio parahaemolyticus TaxID=670 RepID=UPI003AACE745
MPPADAGGNRTERSVIESVKQPLSRRDDGDNDFIHDDGILINHLLIARALGSPTAR